MSNFPDPVRSEGTSKAWATRRANKFNQAVLFLRKPHRAEDLARLQFAAHEISETLAAHLPENVAALPRGYRVAMNGFGERGIAHDCTLFSPCYTAPLPDLEAISRLAADLREGWIREVLEATGATLSFNCAQKGKE